MRNWFILPIEQMTKVKGKENQLLSVFEKLGTKYAVSPLATVLGAFTSYDYHVEGNNTLEGRTGWIWSASRYDDVTFMIVDSPGGKHLQYDCYRRGATVLASSYSSESDIPSNAVRGKDGILRFEEGELQTKPISVETIESFKGKVNGGKLKETGKVYSFDSRKCNENDSSFKSREIKEYIDESGRKFAFIECLDSNNATLPNVGGIKQGNIICLEVAPVMHIVDEKAKLIIQEKAYLSGIQGKYLNQYIADYVNSEKNILTPSKPVITELKIQTNDSDPLLMILVNLVRLGNAKKESAMWLKTEETRLETEYNNRIRTIDENIEQTMNGLTEEEKTLLYEMLKSYKEFANKKENQKTMQ